ncbi:Transcriptional regulator MET31 [Mycena sanguinolenta]|uniref:Transcriptional regulator MET31 n=1 Tax=Mycena sanguinolenta TaxID=230812 RepID=A0A8H6Z9D4_9AGAR|nr:Transcriptional regulator MET31 [Mycena sanguinolenta]
MFSTSPQRPQKPSWLSIFIIPTLFAYIEQLELPQCLVAELSERIKAELGSLLNVPISELEIWKPNDPISLENVRATNAGIANIATKLSPHAVFSFESSSDLEEPLLVNLLVIDRRLTPKALERECDPGFYHDNLSAPASGRCGYSPTHEKSNGRLYCLAAATALVGHQPNQSRFPPIDLLAEYSSSPYVDDKGPGYQLTPPACSYLLFNTRAADSYQRHSSTQPSPPRRFISTLSEAKDEEAGPSRPWSALRTILPSPTPSPRPRSTAPSALSSYGERFICGVCAKSFSRAHDRKRHHETHHAPTRILHKCHYCEKDFSRADSLKRHIQQGCRGAPRQ